MRDIHSSAGTKKRRTLTHTFGLIVATGLLSTLTLIGCSSSSSTSGAGLEVSGPWGGEMFSNATNRNIPLRLQLIQSSFETNDGLVSSTLSGTATVGQNTGDCIRGGKLTGETVGSSVNMEFGDNTFSGRINGSGIMDGIWSRTTATDGGTTGMDGTDSDGGTDSDDGTDSDNSDEAPPEDGSNGRAPTGFAACTSSDNGNFSIGPL